MPYTALEKLLSPTNLSKPGVCLPEKQHQAQKPTGSISNPYKLNTNRWAATMRLICRVLSFLTGGLKPSAEIPGQACPGELLNSALGEELKVKVNPNSWFVMNLS